MCNEWGLGPESGVGVWVRSGVCVSASTVLYMYCLFSLT